VDPFLPAGALVLVTAFTGVGKSLFASQLSIAAMSGLPFLGRFGVNRPGSVLYFDEESPRAYLRDRVAKMDFRAEDPLFLYHFTGVKLDNDEDFELIRGQVEKHKPVLVVFDTLIRFHNADENSASEMAGVMGRLRALANMGPCVMVQIHQSKQGELRVRSRGSSDIVGACDLELALMVKDEQHGLLTLQSVKARMAPIPPMTLKIQLVEDRLEIVEAEDWTTEQKDTMTEILAEAAESLSASALHRELESRGVKVSLNTVRARLAAMGLPYELGPRGAKLYHLAEPAP
jgi:RecA-family ATPase